MPVHLRQRRGVNAFVSRRRDDGSVLQQPLHDFNGAVLSRPMKRGETTVLHCIHICTCIEQYPDDLLAPSSDRRVQWLILQGIC